MSALLLRNETSIRLLNVLGICGSLLLTFAAAVNLHILCWVLQAPENVAWPKYLHGGHGSRLIDALLMTTFLEVMACVVVVGVLCGRHRRLSRAGRRAWAWGCLALTILLVICNYCTMTHISAAC